MKVELAIDSEGLREVSCLLAEATNIMPTVVPLSMNGTGSQDVQSAAQENEFWVTLFCHDMNMAVCELGASVTSALECYRETESSLIRFIQEERKH